MNRRSLLAMVHIAKKDLGLDDDVYRAALANVSGGRDSAAHLTDEELGQVLDVFRSRGWVAAAKGKPIKRHSEKPYVRKVWAMWGELHRKGLVKGAMRPALRAFLKRRHNVADPEWLTPAQGRVVIEGLKAWLARNTPEAEGSDG